MGVDSPGKRSHYEFLATTFSVWHWHRPRRRPVALFLWWTRMRFVAAFGPNPNDRRRRGPSARPRNRARISGPGCFGGACVCGDGRGGFWVERTARHAPVVRAQHRSLTGVAFRSGGGVARHGELGASRRVSRLTPRHHVVVKPLGLSQPLWTNLTLHFSNVGVGLVVGNDRVQA